MNKRFYVPIELDNANNKIYHSSDIVYITGKSGVYLVDTDGSSTLRWDGSYLYSEDVLIVGSASYPASSVLTNSIYGIEETTDFICEFAVNSDTNDIEPYLRFLRNRPTGDYADDGDIIGRIEFSSGFAADQAMTIEVIADGDHSATDYEVNTIFKQTLNKDPDLLAEILRLDSQERIYFHDAYYFPNTAPGAGDSVIQWTTGGVPSWVLNTTLGLWVDQGTYVELKDTSQNVRLAADYSLECDNFKAYMRYDTGVTGAMFGATDDMYFRAGTTDHIYVQFSTTTYYDITRERINPNVHNTIMLGELHYAWEQVNTCYLGIGDTTAVTGGRIGIMVGATVTSYTINLPSTGPSANDQILVCTDYTTGAYAWQDYTGGMTSFDLAGSTGTETISDGNTLTVAAGTGIASTPVTATDTVTINTVWSKSSTNLSPADGADHILMPGQRAVYFNDTNSYVIYSTANELKMYSTSTIYINSTGFINVDGDIGVYINGGAASLLWASTGFQPQTTASYSIGDSTHTFTSLYLGTSIVLGTNTNKLTLNTAGAVTDYSITFPTTGPTDGQILECTTAATSTYTWVTPSGGMTSFYVDGDNTSPQEITNGNTLYVLGGTGASTVASATDTITVNTVWSKSSTNLSPATPGDDIYLHNLTEFIIFEGTNSNIEILKGTDRFHIRNASQHTNNQIVIANNDEYESEIFFTNGRADLRTRSTTASVAPIYRLDRDNDGAGINIRANDYLGYIDFYGDGQNDENGVGAQISAYAYEEWVDSNSLGTIFTIKTIPESGSSLIERFQIESDGAITFNNAYKFPTSDAPGANYILQSNGSGTLSWIATPSSGTAIWEEDPGNANKILPVDETNHRYAYLIQEDDTNYPVYALHRGRSGPAVLQNGDIVGRIEFWSYVNAGDWYRQGIIDTIIYDPGDTENAKMRFFVSYDETTIDTNPNMMLEPGLLTIGSDDRGSNIDVWFDGSYTTSIIRTSGASANSNFPIPNESPGGYDVLMAQGNTSSKWTTVVEADGPLAGIVGVTKGKILVANGSSWTTLNVGSNTQVLTADSGEATGIKWATPSGATTRYQVYSFNILGRIIDKSNTHMRLYIPADGTITKIYCGLRVASSAITVDLYQDEAASIGSPTLIDSNSVSTTYQEITSLSASDVADGDVLYIDIDVGSVTDAEDLTFQVEVQWD